MIFCVWLKTPKASNILFSRVFHREIKVKALSLLFCFSFFASDEFHTLSNKVRSGGEIIWCRESKARPPVLFPVLRADHHISIQELERWTVRAEQNVFCTWQTIKVEMEEISIIYTNTYKLDSGWQVIFKRWLREKNILKGIDVLKVRQCVNFRIELLLHTVYMLNRKDIGKNLALKMKQSLWSELAFCWLRTKQCVWRGHTGGK